jgi:hypothetical protein
MFGPALAKGPDKHVVIFGVCQTAEPVELFIRAMSMQRRTNIILTMIGAAVIWPFAQIGVIAAQAQYFAMGRVYCIEVNRDDRSLSYKPVGSLMEMNGFTMYAPFLNFGGSGDHGSRQWTFHAVLAVDAGNSLEMRNWSYRHQHFDRLTPQQAEATNLRQADCQPQADFVFALPLLANPSMLPHL